MTAAEAVTLPDAPACVPWCSWPGSHVGRSGWDTEKSTSGAAAAWKTCERILGTVGGIDGVTVRLSRLAYFEAAEGPTPDVCPPEIRLEWNTDTLDAVQARTLVTLLTEAAAIIS